MNQDHPADQPHRGGDSDSDEVSDANRAAAIEAAADYRRRLGWWANVTGTEVWTPPGHPLEAFAVPLEVGRRALDVLRRRGLSTPVARSPVPPERWLMLTSTGVVPVEIVLAVFPVEGPIGYAHRGGSRHQRVSWGISLPPTREPGGQSWTWITPDDTPLVSLEVVLEVLRIITGR